MTDPPTSLRGLAVKQSLPLGRVRRVMAQSILDSVQRAALSQITREIDLTAISEARHAAANRVSLIEA